MNSSVRESIEPADRAAIAAVHEAAFGRTEEARLALELITDGDAVFSLVAEVDGRVAGHVVLSRLGGPAGALALGPLAVLPEWQGRSIGSELVRKVLTKARRAGWRSVFVLGEARFYRRFGFRPELAETAEVPWAGPHFAAIELADGALAAPIGPLLYPPAFGSP